MSFLSTTFLRCSLFTALVFASAPAAIAQLEDPSEDLSAPSEVDSPAVTPLEVAPAKTTQTPRNTPDPFSEVNASEIDEDSANTVTYADEEISVNYPAAWRLERLDDGIAISSVATTPTELIATQVVRIAAPPGAVVNANVESFAEEGSAVARYSRATVDGQDAFIVWLADRPDELTSAVATFIGYGSETVLLFSRYAPENTTAEESILAIHASFTDPAKPANTAAESTPADVVEAEAEVETEPETIVPANDSPIQ